MRASDWDDVLRMTNDDVKAASVLFLARTIQETFGAKGEFDHVLCMGIRKGLFGTDASEDASIQGALELSLINAHDEASSKSM